MMKSAVDEVCDKLYDVFHTILPDVPIIREPNNGPRPREPFIAYIPYAVESPQTTAYTTRVDPNEDGEITAMRWEQLTLTLYGYGRNASSLVEELCAAIQLDVEAQQVIIAHGLTIRVNGSIQYHSNIISNETSLEATVDVYVSYETRRKSRPGWIEHVQISGELVEQSGDIRIIGMEVV